ncbi:MAG: hypothetical protein HYX74_04350 [Acidobacteria bacterium]|nr:hypothetical protein [Acidobacteriota bacterium]
MGRLFLKHPRNDKETLGCETCHGPGQAHIESGGRKGIEGFISFSREDRTPVEQRNAVCLRCHEKTGRLYWRGSPHDSRNVACTDCHTIMKNISVRSQLTEANIASDSQLAGTANVPDRAQLAKATVIETCGRCHIQQRAQLMRSSHMPLREGKMDCTSCHNPHGGVNDKLLKANSINETCYACHAEKRGPFLWEHAPVTESCMNCHEAHGSNHEKMLKVSKPRLCQQCHMVTEHRTQPHTRESTYVLNRSCTNCHSQIHGSNHPSATRLFQR